MENTKIISLAFSNSDWHLIIDLNLFLIISIFIAFLLIKWLIRKISNSRKNKFVSEAVVPIELSFSVGGISTKYEIVRNYSNVEIAHRIYIELITRKAAIRIDSEYDLIIEIYDSWYELFQATREELKSFTGDLLFENDKSKELVKLVTDILNKGLRPHLTKYQAKFRKWYLERINEKRQIALKDRKSPQEIQNEHILYEEIQNSIKDVNILLTNYSMELRKFIDVPKS